LTLVETTVLMEMNDLEKELFNMKAGFYDKLESKLQGLPNTYYVGRLMAFELTERNSSYAMALVVKHFVSDNALPAYPHVKLLGGQKFGFGFENPNPNPAGDALIGCTLKESSMAESNQSATKQAGESGTTSNTKENGLISKCQKVERSPYWEHFNKYDANGEFIGKANCKYCDDERSCPVSCVLRRMGPQRFGDILKNVASIPITS
ncbi:hypothetical protein GIB67_011981, partial [Kingdonia uniflora]